MELSTIKIPEKVYIGFQGRRSQDEVPLGFMTPYTTDKAGEKRRATVDNWAKGYGYGAQKTFNSVILENKPMIGFKIGRAIRRSGGWNSSGASFIRIEDPRGFELEITIENLAMCMAGNIIEDGELVQECVWGRDGNKNILLPINSEPYLDSVTTKSAIDNAISLRNIKPGDKIKLITGEEGVYFGGLFPLCVDHYATPRAIKPSAKRYVLKQTDRHGKVTYVGRASIKVGEIQEVAEAKMTPAEIELEIAEAWKVDPNCFEDANNWDRICGFSTSDKIEHVSTTLVERDEKELTSIRDHRIEQVLAEDNNGKFLLCEHYYNFRESRHTTGRSYSYYKGGRNNHNWYSNNNYVTVNTTGFIGYKATVNGCLVYKTSDEQTHFEEADTKRLVSIKVEVKTKNGQVFSSYL
jgi:hypothetical protein